MKNGEQFTKREDIDIAPSIDVYREPKNPNAEVDVLKYLMKLAEETRKKVEAKTKEK